MKAVTVLGIVSLMFTGGLTVLAAPPDFGTIDGDTWTVTTGDTIQSGPTAGEKWTVGTLTISPVPEMVTHEEFEKFAEETKARGYSTAGGKQSNFPSLILETGSIATYEVVPDSKAAILNFFDDGGINYVTFGLDEETTYTYTFDKEAFYWFCEVYASKHWMEMLVMDVDNEAAAATVGSAQTGGAPAQPPTTTLATGTATVVNCNALNIRRGAGVSFEAFNHLVRGDVVKVLDKNGNWYKVESQKGVVGWAYGTYLDVR